jgi:hypothetical protein
MPGIVTTVITLSFMHMCIQYLYYIHPPTTFPDLLSSLMVPTPTGRPCSSLLFSEFINNKKK